MKISKKLMWLMLAAPFSTLTASDEIKVKSELKEVTVFLSGASMTSAGGFTTQSGQQEIVFENLSPFIDANSIQAKGEGSFIILSVSYRLNYLNTQPKTKEMTALEDSIERVQYRLDSQKNIRWVLETEQSMLVSNKEIGGQNNGVSGAELEKVANIFRTRLGDIMTRIQESNLREKKMNEELQKLRAQLNELNGQRNKNTGEVVVAISTDKPGRSKMSLTYNVYQAAWRPVYDLRSTGTGSDVTLEYRAMIMQNTGVDWNNVKLSLSTGNPSQPGTQPVLHPWWVAFYKAINGRGAGYYNDRKTRGAAPAMQEMAVDIASEKEPARLEEDAAISSAEFTTVNEGQTNIQYDISIPYTIKSDNKEHAVSVQSYNIPATYRYYAVPKLDSDAFLLAQITGWEKYNLLSGNINIFFEDTYVGKSFLNTLSTSDTLDVSLGRDKNVVVKRTMMKEFCDRRVIGSSKKEIRTYEISIRNKKKGPIDLEVLDQVPLSKISDIEVEVLETSGARYEKESGRLSWKMKLNPGEEKKLRLGYSVKFPKDKVIQGL